MWCHYYWAGSRPACSQLRQKKLPTICHLAATGKPELAVAVSGTTGYQSWPPVKTDSMPQAWKKMTFNNVRMARELKWFYLHWILDSIPNGYFWTRILQNIVHVLYSNWETRNEQLPPDGNICITSALISLIITLMGGCMTMYDGHQATFNS